MQRLGPGSQTDDCGEHGADQRRESRERHAQPALSRRGRVDEHGGQHPRGKSKDQQPNISWHSYLDYADVSYSAARREVASCAALGGRVRVSFRGDLTSPRTARATVHGGTGWLTIQGRLLQMSSQLGRLLRQYQLVTVSHAQAVITAAVLDQDFPRLAEELFGTQ